MSETETPLAGGRVTAGVVRVGDTVRRPSPADGATVHRLLEHLERQGFDGAPRFLGIDGEGRDILTFLPGGVPGELGHYTDAQLAAASALLRRFHDATIGFDAVGDGQVMCHNDWGPTNTVFRDDLPYGLIDFDTLAPGLRLRDLGYSAFLWLDLGNPDYSGEEQVRRLTVFADGYGSPDCTVAEIAVFAVARQTALASRGRAEGKTGMAEWAAAAAAWTVANVTARLTPAGDSPGAGG
ncbi:MAG: phosphotransferase [Bauldia sp.]|uniref:phosphotransferase n=1 Tax=Bauldia sp. TaxID=2575872 RepID=UPI001D8FE975|nr:phosphotransferase [Bauldia sp.]MCB1494245.1 phosphotransferase [Bauldia sp.]